MKLFAFRRFFYRTDLNHANSKMMGNRSNVSCKSFIFTFFIVFLVTIRYPVSGQESSSKTAIDMAPLETGSVVTQFDFVIDRSVRSEDSRIVKSFWLFRLKSHVVDSVKTLVRKNADLQKALIKKQTETDSLNKRISLINEGLSMANSEKDSLKLLGITFNKKLYHSVVWSIIGVLALAVLVLGWLFRRSNSITVQTKADLIELKSEFETHRKRALEKEAQLARKHLDELNKLKH